MLEGMLPVDEAHGIARVKQRDFESRTVPRSQLEQFAGEGWELEKENQRTVRVTRDKLHGKLLEDRVWSLFYRMKFDFVSGLNGATLQDGNGEPGNPRNQIDVVALDADVALAVECKSQESLSRRTSFQEELGKLSLLREKFTASCRNQFETTGKRQIALVMFLNNVVLSDNDKTRARDANITVFDAKDLHYYESLVSHLGTSARYQFLSDIFPGKTIPNLVIRVPAIQTRMAGVQCYTFSISPQYLLKISYISHRAKGKDSDIQTYQRMISRSRLNRIREYVKDDGIFPTNIVVNLEKNRTRFERVHQETNSGPTATGVLGWLEIRPAYKSAWIIDGQHRLFAYSGLDEIDNARLSVLAFQGLEPNMQAKLFIDINAKQKKVKQSLLQELFADLHKDSDEPEKIVSAIISRAIQVLNNDPDSPLSQRVQTADSINDDVRCITFQTLYTAIDKGRFFIQSERKGNVLVYGPFWGGDNEKTLRRTVALLNYWFALIAKAVPDWWDLGKGEGGGLSMNDGIASLTAVLSSVIRHIDSAVSPSVEMSVEQLQSRIERYGLALGQALAAFDTDDRRRFREFRGSQGQTARKWRCQKAINQVIPEFTPPGLAEYLETEKQETNAKGKTILDRLELKFQKIIVQELRQEFGEEESGWWAEGVPQKVRLPVRNKFEEDKGKRGGIECYFDFIHYREIVLANWEQFEDQFGLDKKGSKDKRTEWMSFLNLKRNAIAHASSGVVLSIEDLERLEGLEREYDERLVTLENQTASESVELGTSAEDDE